MSALPLAAPLNAPRAYNPWAIALVLTIATFMELLDTSIANVALPHIGGSLSADASESTWVLTSYLVANAVVLPLSAYFSTLLGRKRFYMLSVALFTMASMLCALAPSLGWLVFFRVLQGIGGGGLAPSEQAMLVDAFPAHKRAGAFALYSIAIIAAPAIGPTFGGWITDNFSWQWCFLINVPIGIASLALSGWMVPAGLGEVKRAPAEPKVEGTPWYRRFDLLGIMLIVIGFGSLEVVLDTGQEYDWFGSPFVTAFTVIGGLALLGMIIWEVWIVRNPVVDFRLLKDRNLALSCVLYFLLSLTLFGTTVLLPQMFQNLFGYTATEAGKLLSPGGLAVMISAPLIARMLKYVQPKWMAAAGFTVVAYAIVMMTGFSLDTDYKTAVTARIVQGVGLSMVFIPISQIAYSYLAKEKNTQASSLTNLFRNLGGSVGIAFITTMMARRQQVNQTNLSAHVTEFDHAATDRLAAMTDQIHRSGFSLPDAAEKAHALLGATVERHALMLSYLDVLRMLLVTCALAIAVAACVRPFRAAGAPQGH